MQTLANERTTNLVVKEKRHLFWELFSICVMAQIPVRISSFRVPKPKRRGRNVNNLISVSKVNNDHDINNNITKSNSQTKPNMPAILPTNACHILNKVDDLHAIANMNNPSLIMVTESWLNVNVPNDAVCIGSKFNIYRRDRLTAGGGVLAYVNINIPTTHLRSLEEDNKEVLWLLLMPPRTPRLFSTILVVGVYSPQGSQLKMRENGTSTLREELTLSYAIFPPLVCVLWEILNQIKLNTLCRRFNLKKSVRAPTRGANVLDQILTNMSDFYDEVMHLPPVGRSDYQCLLFSPKIEHKVKPTSRKVRLTKPCNLAALGLKLNLEEWNSVFPGRDVNDKVCFFTNTMTKILDETIPETSIRVHASDKPWMTSYIKREIRARQKAYATGNMTQYRHLADKIITLIKRAKAKYYASKIKSKRKQDPAKWHRSISQLVGCEGVNSNDNEISNSHIDAAEILQNVFTKPCSNLPETIIPSLEEV